LVVFTISANEDVEPVELDEDVVVEPRLPAVVPAELPVVEAEVAALPDPDVEALEVDPDETASPGERLASDTIVPPIGAYSFVSANVVSALLTVASAPYTAACADAIVPAGEVVLDELPAPVELVPVGPEPAEPPPADETAGDVLGGVVTGEVAVGAVVACLVVVVVWGVVVA
jgi:hypothetical protein